MLRRPDRGYWGSLRRSLQICGKVIPLNLIPLVIAIIGWHSPNGGFVSFVGLTIMIGLLGLAIVIRQVGVISGSIFLAVYASISVVLILIVDALLQYFFWRLTRSYLGI